ncbi:MAG: response regulator, partial [Holophaga sp.]|nr:response regulator [Holophaga sp.]
RPHSAVVVYLPIFKPGTSLSEGLDRREATVGMVFVSLLASEVFEPILAKYPNLAMEVRDEAEPSEQSRLFSTRSPNTVSQQDARFLHRAQHNFAQRTWLFSYTDTRPTPTLISILPFPLAGIVLAIVFFLLSRSLLRGKSKAERLAGRLHQSEDRFRRMADQAPCGILLLTERIKYVNPYFLKSLGYEATDVIGSALRTFVHPEDRGRIPAAGKTILNAEPPPRLELRVIARDGSYRSLEIIMSNLSFGRHHLVLATAFDITERLQAEERRLDAEHNLLETRKLESLRVLAGGIAHDFNNLLGVVLGNADLAEGQPIPDQNLAALREACLKAAGLTRQLLAFSGGGGMAASPMDLNACIQRALPRIGSSLHPEGRVTVELTEPLSPVLADPTLLEQMVLELLENGLEAAQDYFGSVFIRTCVLTLDKAQLSEYLEATTLDAGDYVSLCVIDHGRGMDADHLARIFDPFFTTKFVGRGLGLAALLGVVRSHRGAVKVTSELGSGSRFEVILPVHEIAETDEGATNPSPTAGCGTVLVVDDEPALLELAVEILQSAGIPVLSASGGREALSKVAAHRDEISLLLLDMAMPDLSGAEVIRALRVSDPGIRIILSSGYAEEDLRKTLQPGDIVAFLPKPYRLASLVELVRQTLAQR